MDLAASRYRGAFVHGLQVLLFLCSDCVQISLLDWCTTAWKYKVEPGCINLRWQRSHKVRCSCTMLHKHAYTHTHRHTLSDPFHCFLALLTVTFELESVFFFLHLLIFQISLSCPCNVSSLSLHPSLPGLSPLWGSHGRWPDFTAMPTWGVPCRPHYSQHHQTLQPVHQVMDSLVDILKPCYTITWQYQIL